MRNSYHGRSFATIGITGNRGWSASSLSPFTCQLRARRLPATAARSRGLSDADYIKACVDDLRDVLETTTAGDVACLIAEPIQGVGGFTMPPDGLFAAFKEVLDEHGILFISDEVQTGWGRTGEHFWGIQAHGVDAGHDDLRQGPGQRLRGRRRRRARRPDGLPAAPNSISTFGGNPISTAGAQRHAATTCSTTTCRPTRPSVGRPACIGGLRAHAPASCRSSATCAARA